MSGTVTPILKLALPPFDTIPWDQQINNDLRIIDGAIGTTFGIANFAGIWRNATAFISGQTVFDPADSSQWFCNISNTSPATGTFAADRTAHPANWSQTLQSPATYAQAAANSATAAAGSAAAAASSAATTVGAVPLTGATMTGPLVLSADPINVRGAATKQYVDARVGGTGFLPVTGGTVTGAVVLTLGPVGIGDATRKDYVDTKIARSGDSMTGQLTLNLSPTTVSHATRKDYVDTQVATRFPTAGGTVTGAVIVNGNILANNGNVQARKDTGNSSVSVWDGAPGTNTAEGFWHSGISQVTFGNVDALGAPIVTWLHLNANQMLFDFNTTTQPFGLTTNGVFNGHRAVLWTDSYSIDFDNTVTTTKGNVTFNTPVGSYWNLRRQDLFAFNNIGPVGGVGQFVPLSDERMKTNIVPLEYDGLAVCNALQPRSFDWIDRDGVAGYHDCGFIAQEVQPILDEAIKVMGITLPDGTGGLDDPNPTLGVTNGQVLCCVVQAIQQLSAALNALTTRVTALETP